MINVSQAYKDAMDKPIRDRAYISIDIGIINQEAQKSASVSGDLAHWSKGNIFNQNTNMIEYATLERNFMRADGTMYFLPEENGLIRNNGIVSKEILGSIKIDFGNIYSVKGITLDFGIEYPTKFAISTDDNTFEYTNDSQTFTSDDVYGEISHLTITPIEMRGGAQRLRLKRVLFGVGLQYTNENVKSFSMKETVSPISEEIPSQYVNLSFYDKDSLFDVDDDNSFIDYMETMQRISISFGVTLEDGTVEWNQISTTYLKEWNSQGGVVSLISYDRLYHMEDTYSLGNRIYSRTAYEEALNIFKDAGLSSDEYYVDEYLETINLENPMPVASHKECLQILANACRCKVRQDEFGKTLIVPNFSVILDRDEISVSTNGTTEWSDPENVLIGSTIVYAELLNDFIKADGTMRFIPENGDYLDTGYVSEQIADENGDFEEIPQIEINLPAESTYYGLTIEFGGNAPVMFEVQTYSNNSLIKTEVIEDVKAIIALNSEFASFDKMVIRFTKASPNSRVIVKRISFGELSDYVLKKQNMLQKPVGYKKKRVKDLNVKIYSYTENENGLPEEIEDNVLYSVSINPVGETKILMNPLIGTEEHAAMIAEWIGNHYANNVSYDVKYRGDPSLNATDIIRMESDKIENLQVEVTSHELTFNGAFGGNLELRRAYNMMGE